MLMSVIVLKAFLEMLNVINIVMATAIIMMKIIIFYPLLGILLLQLTLLPLDATYHRHHHHLL